MVYIYLVSLFFPSSLKCVLAMGSILVFSFLLKISSGDSSVTPLLDIFIFLIFKMHYS
jgi:hypothetical protein